MASSSHWSVCDELSPTAASAVAKISLHIVTIHLQSQQDTTCATNWHCYYFTTHDNLWLIIWQTIYFSSWIILRRERKWNAGESAAIFKCNISNVWHPKTRKQIPQFNKSQEGSERIGLTVRLWVRKYFWKFILIFPEICLNFFSLYTFKYNHMFPTPALQSDARKISTFSTKQLSRSLKL